jgi:hypothetical protein
VADFAHGHVVLQAGGAFVGGGVSDRFALGGRDAMLGAYVTQWDEQLNGCKLNGSAWLVDSEHLLCQHLASHGVRIGYEPSICVVRVRSDGTTPAADVLEARSTREACEGARCCRLRALPTRMDGTPAASCTFPDTLRCPWPNATCGYSPAFTRATIAKWRESRARGKAKGVRSSLGRFGRSCLRGGGCGAARAGDGGKGKTAPGMQARGKGREKGAGDAGKGKRQHRARRLRRSG